MQKSIIIGTAGHIDHGKTALVKALTGVDTDRLPEEKARGITIDIGFAHTNWSGMAISFIDVPGHERFIRNMLAGIGGIDLLMLVVAADESIMPQTREHFDICRLLEIRYGAVVITKKDLVDDETLAVVREEIAGLVHGSFLENAPVFAVSSRTGEGIENLKEALIRQLQFVVQRKDQGVFRLPIDRVFVLKGHGTVVTGTLISGKIRKDSFAEILPSHRNVKIRSIHAHDQSVEEAIAGQRTAVNLQGVEKEEIRRGDVLTESDFFDNTSLLDVKISLLENAMPLEHNMAVRFHHLTNDVLARVTLLGRECLNPGESGFAQLRLQRPLFAVHGDRFILRRHSPLVTTGGGVIIDHMPFRRAGKSDKDTLARLERLESAADNVRLAIAVEQKGIQGAEERHLKAKLAIYPEEIVKLQSEGVILLRERPLVAISMKHEGMLLQRMRGAVEAFHEANPLLPGISKEELRTKVLQGSPPDVFHAILDRGVTQKLLQTQKEVVAVFGRRVALSNEEETLVAGVEDLLVKTDLSFSGFEAMAKELKQSPENVKKILYLLVRQGKVIKIADDYFLHKKAWEGLKQKIRARKPKQKLLSVPDFKVLFGITRKYAIPLLEQLDREGVTRRSGNERIIL